MRKQTYQELTQEFQVPLNELKELPSKQELKTNIVTNAVFKVLVEKRQKIEKIDKENKITEVSKVEQTLVKKDDFFKEQIDIKQAQEIETPKIKKLAKQPPKIEKPKVETPEVAKPVMSEVVTLTLSVDLKFSDFMGGFWFEKRHDGIQIL